MRFLFFSFLFSFCLVISSSSEIPSSPAGGGWFRIYAPGDYAFVPDHDDFEINPKKKGFTIEMWIYMERPMREFVPAKKREEQIPGEGWGLFYKADSYELDFNTRYAPTIRLRGPFFSATLGLRGDDSVQVNQWHYLVLMLSEGYVQLVIDNQLVGSARNFNPLNLNNADTLFCIGGGKPPGPWPEKPFWNVFTGGLIDEVRISNIVRYPKEEGDANRWSKIIEVPNGPFEPDKYTIALWHFDFDGDANSKWRDASGNGHHLTYKGNYLSIQPRKKLATMWGKIKNQ